MAGTMRLTQVGRTVNKTNTHSLTSSSSPLFLSILIPPTISPTVSFPTFFLGTTIIIIEQGHIRL